MLFLSDNETKTDLLYYASIAQTVVKLVNANSEKPISIGIHGDWGAGKSSVLAMIEHDLSTNNKCLCLRFNGWTFQGFEDAKTILLESIVEGIKDARPGQKVVLDKAKELFKRIDWFKLAKKTGGLLLTMGTGLPIGAAAGAIADKLKEVFTAGTAIDSDTIESVMEGELGVLKDEEVGNMTRQIHAFRSDFEALIKNAEIDRLVILIDDLDRCLPETAIQTLEAAKLFLFLPRVAFIVAADEGMIEYSVKQHFPDMPLGQGGLSYARSYLEKLIQVPFRIPALGDVEIHAYISLILSEAILGSESPEFAKILDLAKERLKKPWEGGRLEFSAIKNKLSGISPDIQHAITLSDQLASILAQGTLGNPRQVKRFLNSLLLREAIAEARGLKDVVKRPALAKLMLAERFHPELYAELCKEANKAKDGKVKQLKTFEEREKDIKESIPGARRQDDAWGKWTDDQAIVQWAGLSPMLCQEDLRPYVFVSRDKKAVFGMQAGGPLDDLVELLMGPKMMVSGKSKNINQLTPTEAAQVFEKIKSRIVTEDSYDDPDGDGPPGFSGMLALARERSTLHAEIINFVGTIPIGKLGVWAAKIDLKFTGNDLAAWNKMLADWEAQKENKPFARAVKAIHRIPEGKK